MVSAHPSQSCGGYLHKIIRPQVKPIYRAPIWLVFLIENAGRRRLKRGGPCSCAYELGSAFRCLARSRASFSRFALRARRCQVDDEFSRM
jgi:hypothetical protein